MIAIEDLISAAHQFNENNQEGQAWMHPEDLYNLEADKQNGQQSNLKSVCGIPIKTSDLIEKGTFIFTENLLDEEAMEHFKKQKIE